MLRAVNFSVQMLLKKKRTGRTKKILTSIDHHFLLSLPDRRPCLSSPAHIRLGEARMIEHPEYPHPQQLLTQHPVSPLKTHVLRPTTGSFLANLKSQILSRPRHSRPFVLRPCKDDTRQFQDLTTKRSRILRRMAMSRVHISIGKGRLACYQSGISRNLIRFRGIRSGKGKARVRKVDVNEHPHPDPKASRKDALCLLHPSYHSCRGQLRDSNASL